MAYLIQRDASGRVLGEWDMQGKTITVGRDVEAEVSIDDDQLSRRHFQITPVNHAYVLRDLNSTNGTRVNGRRVTEVTLASEDKIMAGGVVFSFVDGLQTMLGKVEQSGDAYSKFVRKLSGEN
ncbi:MAG: FHA domain-containing protein, partial [Kiritimatiellaeota bacterium]|nr:FHA domain-containing protein [Kiritimatiellota bacterium]